MWPHSPLGVNLLFPLFRLLQLTKLISEQWKKEQRSKAVIGRLAVSYGALLSVAPNCPIRQKVWCLFNTHTHTQCRQMHSVVHLLIEMSPKREREREKLWWQEQHHSMPATTTHFDPLACSEIDFHNSQRWPLLLHWLISAPISSLSGHYPCPWLLQLLFVSLTLLRAICLFLALSVLCHLWPLNWQRRTKV